MSSFEIKIVTLEGSNVYDDIVRITFDTPQGQTTVLPHHEAMLSQMNAGVLEIEKSDKSVLVHVVSGGFIEVTKQNQVIIMLDTMESAEGIDIEAAQKAKKRAEEMLAQKDDLADIEYARIQSVLEHEIARIRSAQKGGRM